VPANARYCRRESAGAGRENILALNKATEKIIGYAIDNRADHLGLDLFIDKLIEQGT
jgi:hypothetical protein